MAGCLATLCLPIWGDLTPDGRHLLNFCLTLADILCIYNVVAMSSRLHYRAQIRGRTTMSAATIQVRIDEETKKQAQTVLEALHLSMSEAVKLFLRQVVLQRGIPFEVKIPNKLTRETLEKAERGEDVKEFASVDELFEDLGI